MKEEFNYHYEEYIVAAMGFTNTFLQSVSEEHHELIDKIDDLVTDLGECVSEYLRNEDRLDTLTKDNAGAPHDRKAFSHSYREGEEYARVRENAAGIDIDKIAALITDNPDAFVSATDDPKSTQLYVLQSLRQLVDVLDDMGMALGTTDKERTNLLASADNEELKPTSYGTYQELVQQETKIKGSMEK